MFNEATSKHLSISKKNFQLKKNPHILCGFFYLLAGAEGFEPPNDGTKNRCLTTWLRPNTNFYRSLLTSRLRLYSSIMVFSISERVSELSG